MGLFSNLFKKNTAPAAPVQEPKKPKGIIKNQRFVLANIEDHMDAIMELVEVNEDYKLSKKDLIEDGREDEKIFQYELGNVKAEIKSISCGGGSEQLQVFVYNTHIGDVKKGSVSRVKNLLKDKEIKRIDAEVTGGNYRLLSFHDDKYYDDKLESVFSITIEITYREEITD